MTILEALILGILQGATEFLPVSSSGHLVLVPAVFGLTEPTLNVVALAHLGTLVAVLIYFFKDVWHIASATIQGVRQGNPLGTTEARLGWYILAGSVPAAVLGIAFEEQFDTVFGTPTAAAFFLLGTAGLLILGEYMRSGLTTLERMSWLDALVIGLFQALALFPGISRSGSTIVGGLLRGLNREIAARYSFLLGIPVIFGAGLLSIIELLGEPNFGSQIPSLVVTFISAAVSGYACTHLLLQWVKQRGLLPFAVYCAAFGLFYLIAFAEL